jgi:hypothetical protein
MKGHGSKRWRPNLRHYTVICLVDWREPWCIIIK